MTPETLTELRNRPRLRTSARELPPVGTIPLVGSSLSDEPALHERDPLLPDPPPPWVPDPPSPHA